MYSVYVSRPLFQNALYGRSTMKLYSLRGNEFLYHLIGLRSCFPYTVLGAGLTTLVSVPLLCLILFTEARFADTAVTFSERSLTLINVIRIV
jgi:hypothetical protein